MALEILGIVAFALIIGLSIALHEIGHLVPAKRFRVRVTEYMVGFGPTLWAKRKGETSYGIKAIPLGGYIRMIGMLPPARGQTAPRAMATGRFAAMIDAARRQSLEELQPGDESRLFYKLPVWKRVIIMMGGPVMNLVLAFVFFSIVLVGIGVPQPTVNVGAVVACTPTLEQGSPSCTPTPAAAVGLQPDDRIIAVDGAPVRAWEDATALISRNAGRTISLTIDRGGQRLVLPVEIGFIERPTESGATERVGFLGVRPTFEYESQGIGAVPGYMVDLTGRSVVALVSLPVRVYELVSETLIGGQERDIDGPVSVVGASRLGGEIAAMNEPIQAKLAIFLSLAGALNLFLFLFNLLPVLPLDGGHVAGALYESGRRGVAKVRGKPDPGPVDVARLLPVAYVVAAVLVGVGVIVIWADLVRPITLS
jgi:membrane-associated protease RseP (regulator of RpoE activity)